MEGTQLESRKTSMNESWSIYRALILGCWFSFSQFLSLQLCSRLQWNYQSLRPFSKYVDIQKTHWNNLRICKRKQMLHLWQLVHKQTKLPIILILQSRLMFLCPTVYVLPPIWYVLPPIWCMGSLTVGTLQQWGLQILWGIFVFLCQISSYIPIISHNDQ